MDNENRTRFIPQPGIDERLGYIEESLKKMGETLSELSVSRPRLFLWRVWIGGGSGTVVDVTAENVNDVTHQMSISFKNPDEARILVSSIELLAELK